MKLTIDLSPMKAYFSPVMRTNLTSPKYRPTINIDEKGMMFALRIGAIRLSPGQWLTDNCGTRMRFVCWSKANDLWVTYSAATFRRACKAWLSRN
jgi:hypothetical protein